MGITQRGLEALVFPSARCPPTSLLLVTGHVDHANYDVMVITEVMVMMMGSDSAVKHVFRNLSAQPVHKSDGWGRFMSAHQRSIGRLEFFFF